MPDIIIHNLSVLFHTKKHKPDVTALDHLSTVFPDKKLSVVLGPSGCGKTTLLRCIAGLQEYDGKISIDDEDVTDLDMRDFNIALVSQQYTLYPQTTIFDNIAFPLISAKVKEKEIIDRVYEIAEQFELTACLTRKPGQISGGQQQRVAIARALIRKPDICLFDEPLSNLDAQARKEQRKYIKNALTSFGSTTVYVTHDLKEALGIADLLIVMNKGKTVFRGTPKEALTSDNPEVSDLFSELERNGYDFQ